MKCHWCHQTLIIHGMQDLKRTFSCPEGHITFSRIGDDVVSYTIYWDADVRARERYILKYDGAYTRLMKPKNSYHRSVYTTIIEVDTKIDLIVENDMVQGETMIGRLKKLKAFA